MHSTSNISTPKQNNKKLISQKELLNSIYKAKKEYQNGKSIVAKSMADLLQ